VSFLLLLDALVFLEVGKDVFGRVGWTRQVNVEKRIWFVCYGSAAALFRVSIAFTVLVLVFGDILARLLRKRRETWSKFSTDGGGYVIHVIITWEGWSGNE